MLCVVLLLFCYCPQSGSFLVNENTFAIEPIDSSSRRKRRSSFNVFHVVKQVELGGSNDTIDAGNRMHEAWI